MAQTEPEPRWHWQDNDMSYIPYLTGDSDLMEAIYQSGGFSCDVLNGKYTIQFGSRSQIKKGSSEEKSRRIIRGTWYWQDSKNKWQPYPEIISETLEGHFTSGKFDTDLTDIGSSIIVVLSSNGTGKQIFKGEDDIFQKIRRGYDGKVVSKGSDSDDYLIRQSVILDKDQTHKFLENQENQTMSQNSNPSSDEIVSKREHIKSNSDSYKDPFESNNNLKLNIQELAHSSNDSTQQPTQKSVTITNTKQRSRNPPRVNLNAKSGVFKEGYAQYLSKKTWKKCYITLDKDCLTVFLNMKPKNRVYWVDIKDVREGSGGDPKNGYVFELDVYFETVKLKTFNIADTEDWIDSINVVIERATKPVENVIQQNVEPVNQQQVPQQQNQQISQQQYQSQQNQQNQQTQQYQPQQNQQNQQSQQTQQYQQQQMPNQQNQQISQQQQYQQQQIPQQNQQQNQQYQQQQMPQQQNQQQYQQQFPQQTYQQYPQQTYQQFPQQPYQQYPQQTYQQYPQQTQQPYQQFQQPYQQYPQTNPQQFFGYNSYGY